MPESRGKSRKKPLWQISEEDIVFIREARQKKAVEARWQLVLGLKKIIWGTLGLFCLTVAAFVLGVLAGRGDTNRWLTSWGLVSPEPPKAAQWSPPPEPAPVAAPVKAPAGPPAPAAGVSPPGPGPAPAPVQPVTGSLTGTPSTPPPTPPAGKKAKKSASSKDSQKAKDEELRRLRREMAAKLKFQNSFDTQPKSGRTGVKQKDKTAKAPPVQVKVARYRDAKAAKAKMAELQKKGDKVSLKQGKDQEGAYFDLLRQAPAAPRDGDNLAKKTPKPGSKKPKPQAEDH
jgi:hypothetical protein